MKYENLEQAQDLCVKIKEIKEVLLELDNNEVVVKVYNRNGTITTIGAFSSSEHSCKKEAMIFIDAIKLHYKYKVSGLLEILDKL